MRSSRSIARDVIKGDLRGVRCASALTVLFGLVAVGQISFRKVDGHPELAAFLVNEHWSQAV